MTELKDVVIYTDGSCLRNPGPGGYGTVLLHGETRLELSGGFNKTTNNRMEIMAAIAGLEALKEKCQVTVFSDSKYMVESIEKGWARKWRQNHWRLTTRGKALNADLWNKLLSLCDYHNIKFKWVKAHAGIVENERCDQLALEAAKLPNQPLDQGYEEFQA